MSAQSTTLDRESSRQVIEQQRRAIAGLLAELSPEEWDHPSLCAGWRARHVAAHLAIRLRATDIDWCHGSGPEVRGPIAALLLLATGRTARLHDLVGAGVAPLTER
ncbi:maleylpyruvate isomerase N-terminal domain-containing protein [Nocardia araoensis]|uniref:maleylpyruvate isomerase N-terminal domain-containing protein n=1 Tax=Nocardia araoensis TaxID=228600 RepID=UPI0003053429|nr:maleylpyruvate isomerase N-terminal domain-containing protein [Nocardia araoensis]